jgi:hypothetical protein
MCLASPAQPKGWLARNYKIWRNLFPWPYNILTSKPQILTCVYIFPIRGLMLHEVRVRIWIGRSCTIPLLSFTIDHHCLHVVEHKFLKLGIWMFLYMSSQWPLEPCGPCHDGCRWWLLWAKVVVRCPSIGRCLQHGDCGKSSSIFGVVAVHEDSLLTISDRSVVAFAGTAAIWKDYYIWH